MTPGSASAQEMPLKVLVFGAGAIGAYIGGSLALQGHSVLFLEQEAIAQQIAESGLHLNLPTGLHHLDSPATSSSLSSALVSGPFDIALFALKSFDTQTAIEQMRPFAAELPPVLCFQNGVENETALEQVLGLGRVIAGTVTSAIARTGLGEISLERLRGIGLASGHPLSERLLRAFNQAGLNGRLYAQPAPMKWSKMVTNLLANATSAILDMTPAEIFAHPGLYRLEVGQLREALQVMAGLGFQVVDLPATPVRALAFAVRSLPLAVSRPILKKAIGGGRGGKMPSFHIDLHSGRGKSEVDYLNGAVVRFGQQVGVPTPVNRLLNEKLLALTRGEISLQAYAHQPARLLKELRG